MTAVADTPAPSAIESLVGRCGYVDGRVVTVLSVDDDTIRSHCGSYPRDRVTVLPRIGEPVATSSGRGVWIGFASVADDPAGWVLIDDRTLLLSAADVADGVRSVSGEADPALVPVLHALQASLSQASRLETEVADHKRWVNELVDDAHSLADDNNWCSQFDEFCRKHGLPPRERIYAIQVAISKTITVEVTASSPEEAVEQLHNATVADALDDAGIYFFDWDVDGDPVVAA